MPYILGRLEDSYNFLGLKYNFRSQIYTLLYILDGFEGTYIIIFLGICLVSYFC